MIISGFSAIIAALFVCAAVLALVILAFFKWRLAAVGFACLVLWLFFPIAKGHISYQWEMAQSDYDHFRMLPAQNTSDPDQMAGYGVTFPDDGSFVKCRSRWHKPPETCRWFEIPNGSENAPITFRIYYLGANAGDVISQDPYRATCETTPTEEGLDYIAPRSCEAVRYDSYHVHLSPQGYVPEAIFAKPPYNDRTQMGLIFFTHGPYKVSATGADLTIDQWRLPLSAITQILDSRFTVLPAP